MNKVNAFVVGDRVRVSILLGPNEPGTVSKVRWDDRGETIYTVQLEDSTATLDGYYLAREWEISK